MPSRASLVPFRGKHAAVLGHNPELNASLRRQGFKLLGIFDAHEQALLTPAEALDYAAILPLDDYFGLEALMAAAVQLRQWAQVRVVNVREDVMTSAALLRQLLGDTGALDRVLLVRDKRGMKGKLWGKVPMAPFASLPHGIGPREALALAEGLGWPLVLKPAQGAGTTDTFFLDGPADLLRNLPFPGLKQYVRNRHRVLERRLEGEEYHADAFWQAGRPLYFQIFRYNLPVLRARAVDSPFMTSSSLSRPEHRDLYTRVERLQATVNKGLGLREGMSHMEFFIEPGGRLVFGEVANRVGGGYIRLGLKHLYGKDPYDLVAAQAAGKKMRVLSARPGLAVATVWLPPPKTGRILRQTDPEEARAWPGVLEARRLAYPGRWIVRERMAESHFEMLVGAPDEAALAERLPGLMQRVRLELGGRWSPLGLGLQVRKAWRRWRTGDLNIARIRQSWRGPQ